MKQATKATAISVAATAAYVVGSVGFTPKRKLAITR